MNPETQNLFKIGFYKRAAEYGLNPKQAYGIYKQADELWRLKGPQFVANGAPGPIQPYSIGPSHNLMSPTPSVRSNSPAGSPLSMPHHDNPMTHDDGVRAHLYKLQRQNQLEQMNQAKPAQGL